MIIDAIIYIIFWITSVLDLIAPEWYLPDAMMNGVEIGLDVALFFDEVFPIHVIIELVLLFLTFELSLLLIKLIIGLIALVRGSGKPEL